MSDFQIFRIVEKASWDYYVEHHANSLYAHRYQWAAVLAETYRLPIVRLGLIDTRCNRLTGVLVLLYFCPPQGERRLISLPYTDGAGILCDDEHCAGLLLEGALRLADELQIPHLELRQLGGQPFGVELGGMADGWHHSSFDFKTGLIRQLPATSSELWRIVGAKVRNQVRKARRSGCVVRIGGAELLDDFYRVFSENMRDLGSPVHSPQIFSRLLPAMAGHVTVVVVDWAEQPVAAAILIHHNATVFNPWASSLRCFRPLCPNMLLYWSMLECGVNSGYGFFDFGRSSPGATTCRFKLQWGAERVPLIWHVYSRGDKLWDPRMESLENEEWKNMALDFSRKEGPEIRRWISL